ncbi:MAG: hypothetical protein D6706_06045 [Chloroflexi bacterium]|nr:MAG: hypothetical protein D6706_06045 [Chloroflexota bacterium]
MKRPSLDFGVLPFLFLGIGLFGLGLLSTFYVVDNFWPIDVARLDLVRDVALDRADPASLLEAIVPEYLLAFLAAILVMVTGLALPLVYVLNRRFNRSEPSFLVVLRQSMWAGIWVAFCAWLQMNRALGVAIAFLVAAVLVLFEVLLQIRTRAAVISANN